MKFPSAGPDYGRGVPAQRAFGARPLTGVSGRAAQLRIAAHPQSAQAFYLLELLHRGILSRPLLLVTEREEDAV
ncbi:MAG: hypothetical protein HY402_05185, partial [Elusimicrobia bacterium]|nr:hypothetical protein [Elusimicrobiota bacterium]